MDIDPSLLFPQSENQKSKNSLSGKYKKLWIEDSLHIDYKPLERGSSHVGNHFSLKRAKIFLYLIGIIFTLLMSRLIYLQLLQGDKYLAQAEGNRERIIPIVAERGLIYDKNGRQLVENVPNFSLSLIPQDLPRAKDERSRVITKLAEITNQSIESISKIIDEYGDYHFESIVIQEDIDYDTALKVYIQGVDLPGIQVQQGSKRLYLNRTSTSTEKNPFEGEQIYSMSHILGYQGKLDKKELDELYDQGYLPSDSIGKTGIEQSYEKYLRGVYGKQLVEVDAFGRKRSAIAREQSKPGKHIQLSIDTVVQQKLERILEDVLKEQGKSRGSALVMDANSGKILAMVSLPSYDNNHFSGGIDSATYNTYINNQNLPLFNRSISGTYPSGSTIKPVIALAALAEGIITTKTSFLSNGGISVGPWFFPDWLYGGHGITNLRKSIAWSVNSFYYYIGGGHRDVEGLGLEKIVVYLRNFNLGKELGLDIKGEQSGFIPSRSWKQESLDEPWYIGDTYNLSIGQGHLLVTPLQIASITATIANKGTIYQPRLVDAIIDPETGKLTEIEEKIIRKIDIDSNMFDSVRQGMFDCVDYGSCRLLSGLKIDIAGKTGTAQWNKDKENHAWFTSFAPYQKPEIVLTVMVEEGGGGSTIAVPIAHSFYAWWQNHREN